MFNEKLTKDDLALARPEEHGPLPREACINTSYGEIRLRLFPDECPKTVENFTTHAANGYYDGVIFHRVIKVRRRAAVPPMPPRPTRDPAAATPCVAAAPARPARS